MNIRICGLCCCLAAGLLFAPAAGADELYSTPITAVSADSKEGDRWWGPAGSLIPEAEWRPYVGRKYAFGGSGTFNTWGADPARLPKLGGVATGARSSGSAKKASAAKPVAAKPKPADPCEERIRQALEEAARTGKIPASAAPSAAGQAPAATNAAPVAQAGTNALSSQGPAVSGVVQVVPPAPVVSGPSSAPAASTTPGAAPNPAAAGAPRNPPPFTLD